jgi:hypothetical protein
MFDSGLCCVADGCHQWIRRSAARQWRTLPARSGKDGGNRMLDTGTYFRRAIHHDDAAEAEMISFIEKEIVRWRDVIERAGLEKQ